MTYFLKKHFNVLALNLIPLLFLTACSHTPTSPSHAFSDTPKNLLNIKPHENQKIALLLPLRGRYGAHAQAIRNGFLAAHDIDKKQRNTENQINIIDTSSGNALKHYQNAIEQGSQVIVGPLTKEEVQQVMQTPEHSVPTLALNTLEGTASSSAKFYQFGLSPVDEYQAITEKAYADGHRNAIILTPNTPWGKTASTTLHQSWRALGGQIADQLAYSTSIQQLSTEIPHLLKISNDKSQTPNHRQDFDVILLASPSPTHAKEMLSLLKFNYVQQTPVYVNAAAYSGISDPERNQELDGIYFCDIPWLGTQLSGSLASIKQHVENLWPQNSQQYPKFYALGADAYRLASGTPGARNGATGTLWLDKENKIHRKLTWFQIRNGALKPLSD